MKKHKKTKNSNNNNNKSKSKINEDNYNYYNKKDRERFTRSKIDRVFYDYLVFNDKKQEYYHSGNRKRDVTKRSFLKDYRLKLLLARNALKKDHSLDVNKRLNRYNQVKDELKEVHRLKVCHDRKSRRESIFAKAMMKIPSVGSGVKSYRLLKKLLKPKKRYYKIDPSTYNVRC